MSEETDPRTISRARLYARLVVDLADALGVPPPALDDPQAGGDLVAKVRALVEERDDARSSAAEAEMGDAW